MTEVRRSSPTATVIATQPGEVRVRLGDNAELPRWYPSVLATTPVSTVGTMLRKNQEDMVFVPEGVNLSVVGHTHDDRYYTEAEVTSLVASEVAKYRTIASSASANQTVTATTAGTYEVTNAALSITGLPVGAVYEFHAVVTHRVNGTTGGASFGFNALGNGVTTYLSAGAISTPATTDYKSFSYTGSRTVGSDGIIKFTPAFVWSSGTVTVAGAYIAVSMSQV